jgi:hypothetical protein
MTPTRHVESDALGSLREELMLAATCAPAGRRRARRAAVVVAIVVALLAATAGAAELTGFTTGVPAVDQLLSIESGTSPPGGSPRADFRPGVGPASEALSVPQGKTIFKTVAYLSRRGDICVASAAPHRGGGVQGSFGGCPPIEWVNRRVQRLGGTWSGSAIGAERRTNQFLVDGRVSSVRPLDEGDWTVLMTPPWTPHAPGARPLRLVVTIDETDIGNPDDGVQKGELTPQAYDVPTLRLTYPDGHTRVMKGRHAR